MYKIKVLFLLFFIVFSNLSIFSQCAMCKATAESSLMSGNTMAGGVNSGILYLVIFPYLIAMAIGFYWYKFLRNSK